MPPSLTNVGHVLTFPMKPRELTSGEAGQARLRCLGSLLALVVYAIAHQSGAFGPLDKAVQAIAVHSAFAYFWGWLVALRVGSDELRRNAVIVLDEAIFAVALWYCGGELAALLWMPIFMTVGNGLRYGARLANISASVACVFVATAFVMSPFWRAIPGVAVGIVLAVFIVPVYAVSLNLKLQRSQREAERRTAELEVANRTDALTGLSNRLDFSRAMQRLLEDSREFGTRGALFYIDLDGFKAINDNAGHGAGDQVLKDVAQQLRASVRANDVVARLGGDEFAIVARGPASACEAELLGAKVQMAIAEIRVRQFPDLRVGATIGACLIPDPVLRDTETVVGATDELMLSAKRSKKGSVRVRCMATP